MAKRFSIIILTALCLFGLTGTVYAIPLPPTGTITAENALIIGTNAGDRVGFGGFHILPSGNLVIASPDWNGDRGAVTCLTPAEYLAGGLTITTENSLTGAAAGHEVGLGVQVLANGNYVVRSSRWDNGSTLDVGAVTWVNGTTCIPYNETARGAAVSPSNSVIGSTSNDQVGSNTIAVLTNGNFIIRSVVWDNIGIQDAGALTWVNGTTGMSGVVSTANSLVGNVANQNVGTHTFTPLPTGNALYSMTTWNNPTTGATFAGAVVFLPGSKPTVGTIGPDTALVGSTTGDNVGLYVTVLSDGDYVVATVGWDNGAIADAGAATWCSGKTGCTGAISTSNSLVGSQANDRIGSTLKAIDNGAFYVGSPFWSNGSAVNAGILMWRDGTSPITGTPSSANALVGTQTNEYLGFGGIVKLAQGGYTISTPSWDNGAMVDVGAVTWSSGLGPIKGTITPQNSIIGNSPDDAVSRVIPLTNGHYIVLSASWDNGATPDVGAVRWANKNGSTIGPITAANAIIGASADDGGVSFGTGGLSAAALTNGHYVVGFNSWDNGATPDVGAVTWANGNEPTSRVVSAANSIIGSTADDRVGFEIVPLLNGHYLIQSGSWDNGATPNVGAITWVDGRVLTSGVVSPSNSMIGANANDVVGVTVTNILPNSNYVFSVANWDSPSLANVGAVVWCDGSMVCSGVVGESNALIGTSVNDIASYRIIPYNNGDYLLVLHAWDNGETSNAGALIYGEGTKPLSGQVSLSNALIGQSSGSFISPPGYIKVLPNYAVIVSDINWTDGVSANLGALIYIEPPQNRLLNPSYESAGSAAKYAAQWKSNIAGYTAGDKRLCGKPNKPIIRTDGACVFQFNSASTPAKTRTLKQTFQNPAWATVGSTLTLTADVEGVKVGTGAKKIILNIKYDNNTTDRATLTIPSGTYDYTSLIGTVKLTRAVKTVTVTINVGKAKGRIRIDNLYLGASSPAALRFPTLNENTTRDGANPFEMPAAPDGFRH